MRRNDGDKEVIVTRSDGIIEQVTSGDLFVMNEAGKTVADYHLSVGRSKQGAK